MEIILIEDVTNLGFTDEIVNVKNGYARNYLFPNKFAIPATESNKKVLAEKLKQRSHKLEKIKNDAMSIAERLTDLTVNIVVKATDEGVIYGSVTNIAVAEALKDQFDIELDRKKIVVQGENIKELGQYKANVALHKDVRVEFNLNVIKEEVQE
ncbi:MAG: 50S ribosomal protein L9 [Bacteroidales bacterium]|nr:50S ribosomal protein L9 [Bacteroidales bacterium]